jgi:hypothetical protein
MRSIFTALLVTTALAAGASPAAARTADNGPQLPPQSQAAEAPAGPSLPSDGGTAPIVFVLVATGGIAALAGAGFAGAKVERRMHGAGHAA